MNHKKISIKITLYFIYFSLIILKTINIMAMEIPTLGSVINYTRSQIPSFNTVLNFIIKPTNKDQSINISQIPGVSLFQPYVPQEIYNFIANLKLTDIKATKDPKTGDEIISAKTEIPSGSGKSISTDIRIILGSQPESSGNTSTPSTKKPEAQKENQTYWQQFESYFNVSSYVNYAQSYIDSVRDSIVKAFTSLKLGIVIELPKGFSFNEINSSLSFLDVAKFKQGALAIGTSFTDPVYGKIEPGFNTILKVELTGAFAKVNNFIKNVSNNSLGIKKDEFEIKGHILPSITGTELTTNLLTTSGLSNIAQPNLVQAANKSTGEIKSESWGTFFFNLANKKFLEAHDLGIKLISIPSSKDPKTPGGYELGVSGGIKLYLNNINDKLSPLDFTGFFAVDTDFKANLSANMAGLLDLSGIGLPLKFTDVGMKEQLDIKSMQNFNLDELTLKGTVNFGPKEREARLSSNFSIGFDGKRPNIFAYGSLTPADKNNKNALSLEDILNLTTSAYKNLATGAADFKKRIPEFAIKNAQFYFTSNNLKYADNKTLNSGITLDAELNLFGGTIATEFTLDETGFDALGYTSNLDLGQIKVVGATKSSQCLSFDTCAIDCDGEVKTKEEKIVLPTRSEKDSGNSFTLNSKNTPDILKNKQDFSKMTGGVFNLAFHPPKNIAMLIDAKIHVDKSAIGKVDSDACINVSTNGIHASFIQQLLNVLDTQITAYAADYKKPKEWKICGKMTPKAENLLGKAITDAINGAKEKAEKALKDASDNVEKARKSYNKVMNNAKRKIDEEVKKAEKNLKEAIKKCK